MSAMGRVMIHDGPSERLSENSSVIVRDTARTEFVWESAMLGGACDGLVSVELSVG